MKIWKDTIIVPPLDIQNIALMINTSDFNITSVTASDSYTFLGSPYGSSNIYIDN
jgi:hypothetical protein